MRLFRLSSTTLTGSFLVLFYRPCCQNSLRETVIIYLLSISLDVLVASRSSQKQSPLHQCFPRLAPILSMGHRAQEIASCLPQLTPKRNDCISIVLWLSCKISSPDFVPLFAEVTEHRRMEHRRQWKFDETLETRYTTATLWREYHIIIYYPYYTWQTSARRMRLHFK